MRRTHIPRISLNSCHKSSRSSHVFSSKRAADPNQIFIYIAAIVIVGFVFLYGFKAVNTFLKSSDDIQLAKFVKDFQSKAASVSTTFGSVQFLTIDIPSKFSRVCIIDPYMAVPDGQLNPQFDNCTNPDPAQITKQICDEWREMYQNHNDPDPSQRDTVTAKNVYFIDQDGNIGYKDYIPDISLVPGEKFLCTHTGQLRLEGEARVAMVSIDDSS